MTRQKKEIIRQIDEIYAFIEADEALGCGFAPAGFYEPLERQINELEEMLAHIRGYENSMAMMMDDRWMKRCEGIPFA